MNGLASRAVAELTAGTCAVGADVVHLPQVDHAPHVCAEPHGRAGVGLVLPDEDGVRDGQQAHQSAVLQELEDFRLVRQTSRRTQVQ